MVLQVERGSQLAPELCQDDGTAADSGLVRPINKHIPESRRLLPAAIAKDLAALLNTRVCFGDSPTRSCQVLLVSFFAIAA